MVEAAEVEPDPGQLTNRLMAHDFRHKTFIPRRFLPSIESPGVDPSRGDILETVALRQLTPLPVNSGRFSLHGMEEVPPRNPAGSVKRIGQCDGQR
jgi:hypothetical protein